MAMTVFTNVASLNAQRNVGKASMKLQTSFQRLSSGLRINSAKDDAAGLAISERMDAQVRGMDQARRNSADAISLSQTVEAGLGEIGDILQRLRVLSVGAASDSNTSVDRQTMENEANELIASLDQIASSTEFNGSKVLDGTVASLTFQTGANNSTDQRIEVQLGGARAAQLGSLARSTTAAVDGSAISSTNVVTINNVNIADSATYQSDVGHVAVTNEQDDSAYAKAKAINASNAGVKATANATTDANTFAAAGANYTLTINGTTIFQGSQAGSVDQMVTLINAQSEKTGVVATNVGNTYTLTAADGRNINVNASTAQQGFAAGAEQTRGTMTITDDQNIVVNAGGTSIGLATAASTINLDSNNLNTSVDLTTRAGALEAIDRLDSAIAKVSSQRGKMGAVQNRLEATTSHLGAISENLSSAKSRIRDADFAKETALLSRNQILQQAASTMLSQANQAPQQALQLLR